MRHSDAHLHLFDLENARPGSVGELAAESAAGSGRLLACSCHDLAEFEATEGYRGRGLRLALSFGIHPQLAVWDEAATLEALAKAGRLDAIGECGFDFFGGRPEWTRNEKNERAQRELFDLQVALAFSCGLPLVIHQRRALDLMFANSAELRRLPAVVFHGWTGPRREAEALLARGIKAFFSFGASILNGNKKAADSCAFLPAESILIETDAPYQPPRGEGLCLPRHSELVLRGAALLRATSAEALGEAVEGNFLEVFGEPT